MRINGSFLACLPGLLAVPLLAQPQIGGGNCSTATLSGGYSATLTGRAFTSAAALTTIAESIGSVTFDGQSKVTFTLTTNTNKNFGSAVTLSGTYNLQANCTGTITITSGDMASYNLEAYNQGKSYLLTGQNGTSSFSGNGSSLPATCPTSITAGIYPINGTGNGLTSGAISSAIDVIGTLQFGVTNAITMNVLIATNGSSKNVSATGTYTLGTNCSATATLTDATGNTYALVLEYTTASGDNFVFSSASSTGVFNGAGRVL